MKLKKKDILAIYDEEMETQPSASKKTQKLLRDYHDVFEAYMASKDEDLFVWAFTLGYQAALDAVKGGMQHG